MPDQAQVRAWVESLAPTPEARRKVVANILRHESEDRMSAADRAIAQEALELLRGDREGIHRGKETNVG